MLGFIKYLELNYDDAILIFNRLIKKYPSHKDIDYAYYMRALSYYEQIKNEELDGSMNNKALENFQQIIKRFPNSKYALDSKQKIIAINENIAAKNMNIGLFYLKQGKYVASINRYKNTIEKFPTSKFIPEF